MFPQSHKHFQTISPHLVFFPSSVYSRTTSLPNRFPISLPFVLHPQSVTNPLLNSWLSTFFSFPQSHLQSHFTGLWLPPCSTIFIAVSFPNFCPVKSIGFLPIVRNLHIYHNFIISYFSNKSSQISRPQEWGRVFVCKFVCNFWLLTVRSPSEVGAFFVFPLNISSMLFPK